MAQKGDKIGWGSDDKRKPSHGSGWIYDGTHWVQYKKNKPTGRKEKHRVSTTAARGLGVGSLVKKIKGKDNKNNSSSNKSTLTKNTKSNTKKPMATWRVDSKENAKLQEQFKKGEKQTYKKAGSKQTDQHKKKKITARSRMEARNREIHGDDKIDALKDRHTAWKKARKEGTLAEWEKTYHPNRKPQYSKKKSALKTKVSKGKPLSKVQITKDPNKFKVVGKDKKRLGNQMVKMKDGRIVKRSSLYK